MSDFEGRTVLVPGAAGDIGAAAAAAFAKAGANLVVTDRRADALEAVAAVLREAGTDVLAHACDQSDPGAVEGLYAAISAHAGRLDAAVGAHAHVRAPAHGARAGRRAVEGGAIAVGDQQPRLAAAREAEPLAGDERARRDRGRGRSRSRGR